MVTVKDKFGNDVTFEMDVDRIIEMEEDDPTFSFMDTVSKANDKCKLSTLNMLCKTFGSTLKDMLDDGFTLEDIANISVECMREAGFISAKAVQQSSADTD